MRDTFRDVTCSLTQSGTEGRFHENADGLPRGVRLNKVHLEENAMIDATRNCFRSRQVAHSPVKFLRDKFFLSRKKKGRSTSSDKVRNLLTLAKQIVTPTFRLWCRVTTENEKLSKAELWSNEANSTICGKD